MAGILDRKKRILDTIITKEGRRQLVTGDFQVKYYSFSDDCVKYFGDVNSGSFDATELIQLEASSLPQDMITFEADDAGLLLPFLNAEGIQVKNGKLLSQSFVSVNALSGSYDQITVLTGSAFASTSQTLLQQSNENFKKLRIISSINKMFDDDGFGVSTQNVNFVIHDKKPIIDKQSWCANINNVESLFSDPRFSNVINFRYLPPINKIDDERVDKTDNNETLDEQLGNYPAIGSTQKLTYEQIMHELNEIEALGFCKEFVFDPTSRNNSLMLQFFEKNFSDLTKLDVFDVISDHGSNQNKVFFVGKIMIDENETNTFIHLFTLVFDEI